MAMQGKGVNASQVSRLLKLGKEVSVCAICRKYLDRTASVGECKTEDALLSDAETLLRE